MAEVRIYRLLIRFDGKRLPPDPPDEWVTERAYTAEDAITQTTLKQRNAWPDMRVLLVEPYESAADQLPG